LKWKASPPLKPDAEIANRACCLLPLDKKIYKTVEQVMQKGIKSDNGYCVGGN
jgi:hypothetical protein